MAFPGRNRRFSSKPHFNGTLLVYLTAVCMCYGIFFGPGAGRVILELIHPILKRICGYLDCFVITHINNQLPIRVVTADSQVSNKYDIIENMYRPTNNPGICFDGRFPATRTHHPLPRPSPSECLKLG